MPDCTIYAVAANGECGPLADPLFNTIQGANDYDPDLLTGWNKRNYNWEFSAGVQHELAPRVGIDVSYFRRWYGNFPVWDDRSAGRAADYDLAHITVPADPNLPNGGGYTVSVYDLKSNRPLSNINYLAPDGAKIETWQGLDVTGNVRLQNGLDAPGRHQRRLPRPRRLRAGSEPTLKSCTSSSGSARREGSSSRPGRSSCAGARIPGRRRSRRSAHT